MESMSVASGCGCKELYRFPHITYPYSSCQWRSHTGAKICLSPHKNVHLVPRAVNPFSLHTVILINLITA